MTLGTCWECDDIGEIHDHHVVPRSKGGTKTVPLCLKCHSKVHGKQLTSGKLVSAAYQRLIKKHGKGNFKWGDPKKLVEGRNTSLRNRRLKSLQRCKELWLACKDIDPRQAMTWRQKAKKLNELGLKSPTGKQLSFGTLRAACIRYEKSLLNNAPKTS